MLGRGRELGGRPGRFVKSEEKQMCLDRDPVLIDGREGFSDLESEDGVIRIERTHSCHEKRYGTDEPRPGAPRMITEAEVTRVVAASFASS